MTSLTVDLSGDTRIVVRRRFRHPPARIFQAHVDPAIIPGWMTGPAEFSMPVCDCDARPGGSFRFEWTNGSVSFHATGEFIEVTPTSRIVHVERMFLPDRTPDNHVETLFADDGNGGTLMTMTMTLPDAATRAAMIATGMTDGMEESYARIDAMD
jgi:uncharacterized protein YndB with AHSA1/START domain